MSEIDPKETLPFYCSAYTSFNIEENKFQLVVDAARKEDGQIKHFFRRTLHATKADAIMSAPKEIETLIEAIKAGNCTE